MGSKEKLIERFKNKLQALNLSIQYSNLTLKTSSTGSSLEPRKFPVGEIIFLIPYHQYQSVPGNMRYLSVFLPSND